jgi:tetraacyldisaccharide 4'-kinase
MIRWLMPKLPLVVGRRRVLAAQLVHEAHPQAILVMDDGFQHLPVHKDITILLDDEQPKNRLCLPAGPYREPRFNRKRADLLLLSRFVVRAAPMQFVSPEGAAIANPARYSVLCALGQPSRFLNALKDALGADPESSTILGDHDPLDAGTLFERIPKDTPQEIPLIVTAKDWVKIRQRPDIGQRTFAIALHKVNIEPEDRFQSWLQEKLHGRPA